MIAFTWCEHSNWILILLYNPASSPSFTDLFTVRDLSVEKKLRKYYVVIQSAMYLGNFRALLENIAEIYFFFRDFFDAIVLFFSNFSPLVV
jgi:hypothetical protein